MALPDRCRNLRRCRLPEIMAFSQLHDMPVLQVRDLIEYMEH